MSTVRTPLELNVEFHFQPLFIAASINVLLQQCHTANVAAGWWSKKAVMTEDSVPIIAYVKADRNVGEMLMLAVSELAEAMEGDRKDLMDDKLPHRKMLEVELADCMIRLCDLAGAHGFDLGGAVAEKMAFNMQRADHQLVNREAVGGKKY